VQLYNYYRSSAAYRVRIALNLKGIGYEAIPIHLTKDGGKQFSAEYRAINPQARVPSLVLDDRTILHQSLAICEYLEETHPAPALLPKDPVARAKIRAVAQIIACDIHPIDNLAPLNYLRRVLKHNDDEVNAWYRHWVVEGFNAIEELLGDGPFCFGSQPTLADVCLVPQVYNAKRFKVSFDKYPKIAAAEAACQKLPAFEKAKPENQPDAE
jgi:maleylpyruvate isomerase